VRKKILSLYKLEILGIAITLVVTSCGSSRTAELVIANSSEPETLDPALITAQADGRIASALFEGLLMRDPSGALVPGVAKTWEVSPDGLTYRFYLRNDARWSDGKQVVAKDFVDSWRRALSPSTGSKYVDLTLYHIRGAKEFHQGETQDFRSVAVRALADDVLEVQLLQHTPYFLDLCAFVTMFPVRVDLIENPDQGDWMRPGKLVSNGAYVLESWRINDRIRLRANPYYWNRENVQMKLVDILPIQSATTALNFYLSGMVDVLPDKSLVPTTLLDVLRKRPDFHSAPILATYFFRINVTRPPFDNKLVRQALALALDREFIVRQITRAGELPTGSLVPPGLSGYDPPVGLLFKPDAARTLLAQAGYPNGRGFPIVELLYNPSEINDAIAEAVQSMWSRELGLTVELRRQEFRTYLSTMSELNYTVARSSWIGDYADPNTFLGCFHSSSGNNRTGYNNLEYDTLLEKAANELNSTKRMQLLRTAEEILVEKDVPIIPVFHFVTIKMFDPKRFTGVGMNLLDDSPIQYIRRLHSH